MKALILAAGVGTRLEPLTLAVPKPMMTIIGKPVMQFNIELLVKYGLSEISANLHYFPEQIENYFSGGSRFKSNISYSFEPVLTGTAGGVYIMGRVINDIKETFVVMSADSLTDINIAQVIAFHKSKKSKATIVLKPMDDVSHFGVVILDKDKKIMAFQEKPESGKELSKLVNTGIYVFEPEILDMIPPSTFYDFGKQLFPILVEKGIAFFGYETSSYWCDIGTIPQYKQANMDFGRSANIISRSAKIAKTAVIEDGSIIGDRCVIREGTRISKSIIWAETIIDSNVSISDSIIGNWCYVERGSAIANDCVVANRSRVRFGSMLKAGTLVLPDQIV